MIGRQSGLCLASCLIQFRTICLINVSVHIGMGPPTSINSLDIHIHTHVAMPRGQSDLAISKLRLSSQIILRLSGKQLKLTKTVEKKILLSNKCHSTYLKIIMRIIKMFKMNANFMFHFTFIFETESQLVALAGLEITV